MGDDVINSLPNVITFRSLLWGSSAANLAAAAVKQQLATQPCNTSAKATAFGNGC
jgi:hypothetical protein